LKSSWQPQLATMTHQTSCHAGQHCTVGYNRTESFGTTRTSSNSVWSCPCQCPGPKDCPAESSRPPDQPQKERGGRECCWSSLQRSTTRRRPLAERTYTGDVTSETGNKECCHNVWCGKTRMIWLAHGENFFYLCLFVSTESTNVTNRRTDGHRMTA